MLWSTYKRRTVVRTFVLVIDWTRIPPLTWQRLAKKFQQHPIKKKKRFFLRVRTFRIARSRSGVQRPVDFLVATILTSPTRLITTGAHRNALRGLNITEKPFRRVGKVDGSPPPRAHTTRIYYKTILNSIVYLNLRRDWKSPWLTLPFFDTDCRDCVPLENSNSVTRRYAVWKRGGRPTFFLFLFFVDNRLVVVVRQCRSRRCRWVSESIIIAISGQNDGGENRWYNNRRTLVIFMCRKRRSPEYFRTVVRRGKKKKKKTDGVVWCVSR